MKISLLKKLTKAPDSAINYIQLVDIIKNHPQKDLIRQLRSKEYKSLEYNRIKKQLLSIMPHGIFNGLTDTSLVSLSGYLYYDIDGFNNDDELMDVYQKLIDTQLPCLITKSVGGKGLSILIEYKMIPSNIPNDTFYDVYFYVYELLINKGFNIDNSAKGLSRKWIISHDTNPYLSNNVLNIDQEKIYGFRQSKQKQQLKERVTYELNDTFCKDIIPYDKLRKEIKLCTELDEKIDGIFLIKEIDYYCINIYTRGFNKITDGNKHKEYTRLVNALCYLNPTISFIQIYSYLYFINENYTTKKMEYNRLYNYTNFLYNKVKKEGVYVKTRKKKIHFNTELKLNKKEKQSMAAKINGKLRTNNKVKELQELKDLCIQQGIPDTQKNIVELAKELGYKGFSIATVKRLWNKKEEEIDIEIKKEKQFNFPTIDEELFFN